MTAVWCNWPVSTNAIEHGTWWGGGFAWQIPLMPCQFSCQACTTPPHIHTRTSVIIKQSPTSGGLTELQEGPGTHPSTGLFSPPLAPPPPSLLSAQWGVSKYTLAHNPPPAEKNSFCIAFPCYSSSSSFFSLLQPIAAFAVKAGGLRFGWAFTLTKTSQPDQSVRSWHTRTQRNAATPKSYTCFCSV